MSLFDLIVALYINHSTALNYGHVRMYLNKIEVNNSVLSGLSMLLVT